MMPILLLLLLALISLWENYWLPPESLGDGGGLVVMSIVLGGIWLVGHFFTSYACRLMRHNPNEVRHIGRRAHSWQTTYFVILIVLYFLTLDFSGLGHWFRQSRFNEWALVTPLFLVLACSWARFYDLEKTAHDIEEAKWKKRVEEGEVFLFHTPPSPSTPFISRWGYVALQARFNLIFIVPPLILLPVFRTASWLFPETDDNGSFITVLTVAILALAMLSIPWLLRFFLGLRPLGQGPMREQLEAVVRRLSFRCSDILVWNTHNSSANAMVTGMLPWGRFIVLTDRLLNDLTTEEVEAVVGHEIGHVKHHHMLFFAIFLMSSVLAISLMINLFSLIPFFGLEKLPSSNLDSPPQSLWDHVQELIFVLGKLAAVAAYIYFVFGWLSRSCERQADLFGARTVSGDAFISALEKVALLNGISREHPGWFSSWRHPPIARRVEFVREMEQHPELAKRYHRRLWLVKWSLAVFLAGILAWMIWS